MWDQRGGLTKHSSEHFRRLKRERPLNSGHQLASSAPEALPVIYVSIFRYRPAGTAPGRSRTTYHETVGDLDSARAFALSLPGATEEPHFDMSSFRVRGKIFATVPPDHEHLHVFVDEGELRAAVAEDQAAFEPLLWGQRLRGLRIRIAAAPNHRIAELLEESWRRRAPARLAAERDAERGRPG